MNTKKIEKNQTFGIVKVIEYDTDKNMWKCSCKCGKICYKTITMLHKPKHPSCGCEKNIVGTLPDQLSLKRSVILSYKTGAEKKGLTFKLTEQEMLLLFSKNCHYCGSPPSNKVQTRKRKGRTHRPERDQFFTYNGVDRVDSSLGYSLENCVPCCIICNISKNDLPLSKWKDWIQAVYSRTLNDYAKAVEPSGSKQETPEKSG